MTGMAINQTSLSLYKKQGYGMTNPDPKCPVMRRRPLAVTFGPQRSAKGGQVQRVNFFWGELNFFKKTNLMSFAPALKNTVHTVQFL